MREAARYRDRPIRQYVETDPVEAGQRGSYPVAQGHDPFTRQRLGPCSAPSNEPTVAPLESVSRPPLTTWQIDLPNSPFPNSRAATIRAVLPSTCTQ